ncbi:MAG: 50S ribosomal protein L31e [Candidatus Odinarchaeum yellowstonii]|uniref:Large ribosomal subunit protein eL31 n=1 Tax=Odinarchaeota yellowstonii (strain LCB_4) TaxID=1841599 RepID=A0AAF0D344_ODILC|nr:MAG: 50S ribosomal protein L31e [Candidatus Odinarchaeum yellowstonii]
MSTESKTQTSGMEIVEERVYTIPLKDVKKAPTGKRSNKAVRILREFIAKHMKTENVIIDPAVNERIWMRGIEKPPRRIKVKALKDREGVVEVLLAEE